MGCSGIRNDSPITGLNGRLLVLKSKEVLGGGCHPPEVGRCLRTSEGWRERGRGGASEGWKHSTGSSAALSEGREEKMGNNMLEREINNTELPHRGVTSVN